MNNLEAVLTQLLDIKHQIATLKQQAEELEEHLRETYEPGTYAAGEHSLTVTKPTRRLDARKLAADFPPAQYPHLYKQSLDTGLVKQNFAPDYLDTRGYYTQTTSQIRVK